MTYIDAMNLAALGALLAERIDALLRGTVKPEDIKENLEKIESVAGTLATAAKKFKEHEK